MNEYYLSKGSHATAEEGRCAMEWVAYIAGESHTDQPVCVDPPLRAFCVEFNDVLDDEQRQKLRPYLARCIGTAGDGRTEERGYLCLDWIVRTHTPAWLELAGLTEHAHALRGLPEITNLKVAQRVGPVVDAAGAAAWDAARDAAGDAARAAARVAARDAAGAAAREAVGVAARDAAGVAAWDAAGVAAWDAAGAAAAPAAWVSAWDAAWVAARDVLAPTVRELQASAFGLLDRMLPLEPLDVSVRASDAVRVRS